MIHNVDINLKCQVALGGFAMPQHPVVSQEEWLTARKALLTLEKRFTHLRDKIRAERLALPCVKVDKEYVFDTPTGKKTLAELFDGRSQLVIYHFMLGPGEGAGCPACSFMPDHLVGTLPPLQPPSPHSI